MIGLFVTCFPIVVSAQYFCFQGLGDDSCGGTFLGSVSTLKHIIITCI